MANYDDKAIIEFLRKSYFVADGLWYVKVEESHSTDEALRLDEEVWKIVPKIQARKTRELLGIEGSSLANLATALGLKFMAEGYDCETVEQSPSVLRIRILTCPWYDVLKRSGRTERAVELCDRICGADLSIWAKELARGAGFSIECKMSEGAPACEILYTLADAGAEK